MSHHPVENDARRSQPVGRLSCKGVVCDGDESSEVDAAAVASWPQWERLLGGGSEAMVMKINFFLFCVECGACDDFRVCLGFQ